MTPEEALSVADKVLYIHTGKHLTDIQHLILIESLADKGYEEIRGYAAQHIKNEGKKLWAALSEALDEKVSKTNFRGALKKHLQLTQIIPKPPSLSAYDAETWAGRDALIKDLLNQLHGQTRLLCLTGISGIGKTALAECLAVQFQNPDTSFHRVSFDIVGQSQDFTAGATGMLAELGDKDLDPKELNDPKRLSDRLLRKLQMHQYWLQLDALERLLNPEHPTEFTDPHWLGFFQRCLSSSDFPSHLVLTAQAVPSEFARFEDDHPHAWSEQTLRGLSETEQLELFGKYGVTDDSTNDALLSRIGQTYEGHPLVLRVIGGEIRKDFGGNFVQYWERYGNEFEQVACELQSQRVNPALYNQTLQKRVRQRVEISLRRLPEDALNLLCCSAVYRRPVLESFWLVMLDDLTSLQQEAYHVLRDRALVEQEGVHRGQFLIRQHNLIRDVAYDLLRQNSEAWEIAERKAAKLWLTSYEPVSDGSNLDKVRGEIEAFYHFYQVRDWDNTERILITQKLTSRLQTWSYYSEMLLLNSRLLNHPNDSVKARCLKGLGTAYSLMGNYNMAVSYFEQSLRLTAELGDTEEQSSVLNDLGAVFRAKGDYKQSLHYLEQSLALTEAISNVEVRGSVLGNLGNLYNSFGNYSQAIVYLQQALDIFRENNNLRGQVGALSNIGNIYVSLSQYQLAIDYCQQGLTLAQSSGNQAGEGRALTGLGRALGYLGDFSQASTYLQQALEIFQQIGNRMGEGKALNELGTICAFENNFKKAINYHEKALEIFQQIGDSLGESQSLFSIGLEFSQMKQAPEAIKTLKISLKVAKKAGNLGIQAQVLKCLAELHKDLGERKQAQEYCDAALEIATELSIPLGG